MSNIFESATTEEFMLYQFYLMVKSILGHYPFDKAFKDLTEKELETLKTAQKQFKYPEPDVCPECGRKREEE